MPEDERTENRAEAVLQRQQQFWDALRQQDAHLFMQVLADDFVCRSPGQPDQARSAFIHTLTTMPIAVIHVAAEQLAIQLFDNIAILTATQVALIQLPNHSTVQERLALTNVFRRTPSQWRMVLAHPVPLPNQPRPNIDD